MTRGLSILVQEIVLSTDLVYCMLLQLRLVYSLYSEFQFDLDDMTAPSLMDLFKRQYYLAVTIFTALGQ